MENALKNMVANKKSKNLQKKKEGIIEMNLREIKSMSGLKKCLTRIRNSGYSVFRAQNSKVSGVSAPERIGDFFISDFIGSARNILNNSACLTSRFELPIPHVLRELIKKGSKKMKENLQNIIEELNHPINALSDRLGKFALLEIYAKENANG